MSGGADVVIHELKIVREGRTVLDIPELELAAGAVTAVLGPNGAGKTTLLRAIAGLERPATGEVRIAGRPAGPASGRRPVAYAFQSAVFIRGTVRENLGLGLRLQQVPAAESRERIAAAAAECGISGLLDRPARELSGGEAQRVNLARALALGAAVTLLDEPLAGIDRAASDQLLDDLPALLERFAGTTIVVTHDRDEALRLADRLVVLARGRVIASGSKQALYAAPPDVETAELLGFTVVESNGRPYAVPSGGFRLSGGADAAPRVSAHIERVTDVGGGWHVLGRVGLRRVEFALRAGEPAPPSGAAATLIAEGAVPIIFAAPPEPEAVVRP